MAGFRWHGMVLGIGLTFLSGLPPVATASAQQATDPSDPEIVQGAHDLNTRFTVPVSINGKGPYSFVVDTAAERTVISRELAGRLALDSGEAVTVLSISGYDQIDTAIVPTLQLTSSRSRVSDLEAPMMGETNLGASGLLGIDSLKSKRVVIDFKAGRMSIVDATTLSAYNGDIVVTARSKFGQLILVDASADGQKVNVIIDTGSQVSIGNPALRAKLAARNRLGPVTPVTLLSVTGGEMAADYSSIAHMRIGGVELKGMPVAFTDAELFHKLGLTDKPSLLLGMDVLRNFSRVSVDFANRSVRFLLPGQGWQIPPVVASADRRAIG
jgi:predicted aspartyl protease